MDRSSLSSFLNTNNGGGAAAPSDNTAQLQQQDGSASGNTFSAGVAGSAVASQQQQADDTAGYPLLLQQYLRQQQQDLAAQQQLSSAQQNSHLAFSGLQSGNGMMMNPNFGGLDASAAAPMFFSAAGLNGMGNWGPGAVGFNGNQAPNELTASEQLLLQARMSGSGGPPARDPYAEQGILGPWSERSAGLLGTMVAQDPGTSTVKVKRTRRKQPKDKPKRPLSAYNIFFKEERARLLAKMPANESEEGKDEPRTASGKIGFENLAKIIGGKWQDLKPSDVEYYKDKAASDMERYKQAMDEYNKKQASKNEDEEDSERSSKRQRAD